MGTTELVIIVCAIAFLLVAGLIVVWRVSGRSSLREDEGAIQVTTDDQAELEDQKRELHNKAQEDLARAIEENASFIKQDVRRTTSQLNGYMQQEVSRALGEEISRFADSTDKLEKVATESINRMQELLNERYLQLSARVDEESAKEKERIIARFEDNMTEVVSYYVKQAVGSHLDVNAQLEYIVKELESNKSAIIEDLKNA